MGIVTTCMVRNYMLRTYALIWEWRVGVRMLQEDRSYALCGFPIELDGLLLIIIDYYFKHD